MLPEGVALAVVRDERQLQATTAEHLGPQAADESLEAVGRVTGLVGRQERHQVFLARLALVPPEERPEQAKEEDGEDFE